MRTDSKRLRICSLQSALPDLHTKVYSNVICSNKKQHKIWVLKAHSITGLRKMSLISKWKRNTTSNEMHIMIQINYGLLSSFTLPVQRILCLLKSQFHNGPSTSPHFLQYSHSCHHHSHHCKLFSPFCDWNHLLGPADAAVFFLHSKPKHEK